ncbi:hypothetical protein KI387_017780, partial [Taxus chinensis]
SEIEPHIVGCHESLKRSLDVAKGNAIEKVVNVQLERAASGKNLQRRIFVEEVMELVELSNFKGALIGLPGVN